MKLIRRLIQHLLFPTVQLDIDYLVAHTEALEDRIRFLEGTMGDISKDNSVIGTLFDLELRTTYLEKHAVQTDEPQSVWEL